MFYNTDHTTSTALRAKFAAFADAANCAVRHAQQRGPALVSHQNGPLVADFRKDADGRVTAADTGRLRALGLTPEDFAAMTGRNLSTVYGWGNSRGKQGTAPTPAWVGLLLDAWERAGVPGKRAA